MRPFLTRKDIMSIIMYKILSQSMIQMGIQLKQRDTLDNNTKENLADHMDDKQERVDLYHEIVTNNIASSLSNEAKTDIEKKSGQEIKEIIEDSDLLEKMRSLTRKEATKNLPQNSDAQAGYALLFLRANVRHRNKSSFSDSHLSFTKAKKRLQPDMI